MDRRTFLRSSVAFGATSLTASTWLATRTAWAQTAPPPFEYGVASGDPLSDAVVIWTRVTPADAGATPDTKHGTGAPVTVRWEVATDEAMSAVVASGQVVTAAASDHTVKVDVRGLTPGTFYWYRFTALGEMSPVARTKTAPADATPDVRFGVASCANWEAGYFGAYRGMAELAEQPGFDLDFVLHVGDYIYEYGNGEYGPGDGGEPPRLHDPATEMVALDDYRRRHAQYKTDPHLRLLHLRFPFITTWDDHEMTDNAWWDGAENHQEPEGDWQVRKRMAIQAYFEWMPVREQIPSGSPREEKRLYRSFTFGDLVELFVLDLRQYRDEQAHSAVEEFGTIDFETLADPDRTIAGPEQLGWLIDGLTTSSTAWRMVANPVMITPLKFGNTAELPDALSGVFAESFGYRPESGAVLNADDWSGYPYDQERLLGVIAGTDSDPPVKNVVFLTGDIHTSWACDVPIDQGSYPVTPSVAAEFVCPSITSQNIDEIAVSRGYPTEGVPPAQIGVVGAVQASNPQVKYLEPSGHGFCICDVTAERVHQDWYFIADRRSPDTAWDFETSWEVLDQTCAVSESGQPLGARVAGSTVTTPPSGSPTASPTPAGGSTGSGGTLAATGGEVDAVLPAALVAGAGAAALARRHFGAKSTGNSAGDLSEEPS